MSGSGLGPGLARTHASRARKHALAILYVIHAESAHRAATRQAQLQKRSQRSSCDLHLPVELYGLAVAIAGRLQD